MFYSSFIGHSISFARWFPDHKIAARIKSITPGNAVNHVSPIISKGSENNNARPARSEPNVIVSTNTYLFKGLR